jgi:ATP-dependent DNA helicase RecQ
MSLTPAALRLRRAARRQFGWDRLRPAQLGAARALLAGRDALVVLPTGGGKSAVYQLPAALLDGPTVVVSPLLALQQDQLAGLNRRGDDRLAAVRVSSAETPKQRRAALEALRAGRARYLFITPEQLVDPARLAEVRALRPALVAVDEAHCVSSWGYDFRPDYLQLGHVVRELGRPPVVALTATASPPVRLDITAVLGLRDPYVVVAGLDRPNLELAAVYCPSEDDRWRRLLARVREAEPPGVVYAPTRRGAEELAARLVAEGVAATAFHAGLAGGERSRRYEEFMAGRIPVMVATSAFGMGVDKPDIRWVLHAALPDSPDSYLQEIGRAGRDGAPARTLLLHRPEDVALQRFFAAGAPQRRELTELAAALREQGTTRAALAARTGLPARRLAQLVTLLEQVGAVCVGDGGRLTVPPFAPDPAEAADAALHRVERHQALRRSRVDMMRQYAETDRCRGRALLGYFGEQLAGDCGHCDNCTAARRGAARRAAAGGAEPVGRRAPRWLPAWATRRAAPTLAAGPDPSAAPAGGAPARPAPAPRAAPAQPFPVSSQVRHVEWGTGTVMSYEQDRMVVLFDEVGYRTLSVPVVRERGLLVTA